MGFLWVNDFKKKISAKIVLIEILRVVAKYVVVQFLRKRLVF